MDFSSCSPVSELSPFPSQTFLIRGVCLRLLPVIFKMLQHKRKNKWHSPSNTLQVPDFFLTTSVWSFSIFSDNSTELFPPLATSEVTKCMWQSLPQLRHWARRPMVIGLGRRVTSSQIVPKSTVWLLNQDRNALPYFEFSK